MAQNGANCVMFFDRWALLRAFLFLLSSEAVRILSHFRGILGWPSRPSFSLDVIYHLEYMVTQALRHITSNYILQKTDVRPENLSVISIL